MGKNMKQRIKKESDLKNTKILDYTGYAANGNNYEGLAKTAFFSVNEKWRTMCAQAGVDPKTGQIVELRSSITFTTTGKILIALIGAAALIGIMVGIMLFIRLYKKKCRNMIVK